MINGGFMKRLIVVGAFVLANLSGIAHAGDWKAGIWGVSPQQVGRCQIDEFGKAQKLEIRTVACQASDGSLMRDQDCDGRSKPEGTRWLSCKMQWSCSDWHPGQFAEAETVAMYSFRPARSSKIGATVACTNAKEANPSTVDSCRASLVDGELQRLANAPEGFTTNENYAWIGCKKVPD